MKVRIIFPSYTILTISLSPGIEVTPAEAFVGVTATQIFVCTATVDANTEFSWSKIPFGATEHEAFSSDIFDNTAYNTEDGTRTSTLTLASLVATASSDSIRCYDTSELGISTTVSLTVVGK